MNERTDRPTGKVAVFPINRWGLKLSDKGFLISMTTFLIIVIPGLFRASDMTGLSAMLIAVPAALGVRWLMLKRRFPKLSPIVFDGNEFCFPGLLYDDGLERNVIAGQVRKAEMNSVKGFMKGFRRNHILILTDANGERTVLKSRATDVMGIKDILASKGIGISTGPLSREYLWELSYSLLPIVPALLLAVYLTLFWSS